MEENEETEDVGISVANAGQTRGTYNISYWYSDASSIGYWQTVPNVYYCLLSGTTYFNTAMSNGTSKWRNKLGIPVYSISTDNDELEFLNTNQIQFYQGSDEELIELGIFYISDIENHNNLGLTTYNPLGFYMPAIRVHSLLLTRNNTTTSYNCYAIQRARGFIRDFGSNTTKYNSVCAHEIGHALGWWGHSSDRSDVMYSPYQGVTSLTDRDKYHLKQVYDLLG